MADQKTLQQAYHTERFGCLGTWAHVADVLSGLLRNVESGRVLGLDQMGHFGPQGCQLLAEEIIRRVGSGSREIRLLELGSGYGGALRDLVHRLTRADLRITRAIGLELVDAFCHGALEINRALGTSSIDFVIGDAKALPFEDGGFDFVVLTGSMPHMAEPSAVFVQAQRVLRQKGVLLFTEEVSLVRDPGELGEHFLATHPHGVFHFATRPERCSQLALAGFEVTCARDLSSWALALLDDRKKAFDMMAGTMRLIFGIPQTARIEDALNASLAELERGSLTPALFVAEAPAVAPSSCPG